MEITLIVTKNNAQYIKDSLGEDRVTITKAEDIGSKIKDTDSYVKIRFDIETSNDALSLFHAGTKSGFNTAVSSLD
jgi:hypothetical protein